MQARRTEIELVYQGTALNANILRFLDGFTYKDSASGEADQLELNLSDKEGLWIDSWFPKKGDKVKSAIKTTNWNFDGDKKTFPCGTFMVDEIQFSGRPRTLTLGALSIPMQEGFSATEKTKTWEKVTVQEVAKQIAISAGISLYYECDSIMIDEMEQSKVTDMKFLYDLCQDYGISMKVYNNKMILFDEKKFEKKASICTFVESDFISWGGNTTIYGTYDGVEVSYQSTKKSKAVLYQFHPRKGKRILKCDDSASSLAEAERIGKAKLRKANKEETTFSFTKKGDLRLFGGCCINLKGLGVFDGKYYIDAVSHKVSGGFTTSCELHKVLEGGY